MGICQSSTGIIYLNYRKEGITYFDSFFIFRRRKLCIDAFSQRLFRSAARKNTQKHMKSVAISRPYFNSDIEIMPSVTVSFSPPFLTGYFGYLSQSVKQRDDLPKLIQ